MVSDKVVGLALEAFDGMAGYSKIEKMRAALEAALSTDAEPVAVSDDENPMRFFSSNVDNWGALEWFNRMADACEDYDRKRTQAFRCTDDEEKDMLSLSADTSKMIMSSSAFQLARQHKDEILSALSAQVQDVAEYERREQVCKDSALWQWERSLKRPDLTEKDRVIGAVEAYKRQAFAFTMLPAAPAAKQGEAE